MAHLRSNFKTLICFPTLSIFLLFLIISVLSDGPDERGYMLRLMKALTPTPPDWSNNTHICYWTGVTCAYGIIDRIDISSKSLTGILPSGLNDSLPYITGLYFHNNSLSGPLPSLANLGNLQRAYLSDNNFTSIPEGCFQGLIGLQVLLLRNNVNLKPWKFPTELTDSSALVGLDLSVTNLVGSLPDKFHSFPNLMDLDLSMNNFSGVLPQSFAQSKIQFLYLNDQSHDKLSSTIEILSSMTNLQGVWLQGNRFEGPIPDLSNCTQLDTLFLQDNQLTGVVPPSLMSLSSLQDVSLDNNWLQGPFPVFNKQLNVTFGVNTTNGFCLDHAGPCDQRVTTLLEIDAGFGYPLLLARSWRGNNPCKGWRFIVCDGGKIRTVNLTKLNLTGTISPAFGNLTDLRHLYLAGNDLRGSIPESLATLPLLEVVDVSHNNLSGSIPRFSHKVKFTATGNAFLRHSQANTATPWIAGASAVGAGVIVTFVVMIYNRKTCLSLVQVMMLKKTSTCNDQNVEDFIKNYGFLVPKRYSYSEIKKMTNLFRDKLGQGGYGSVFKATLTDNQQVAVKVLSDSKGSGEDFINEVASISRTSHVNIVSLLGFCYEMNKRALIYEFMPNGSLDEFINEKESLNANCDFYWNTLYKIVIGIARGLEYLHHGCSTRILHLDIKPQNILLDEDFCPKISDFGLAKICRKKESCVSVLGLRGTIGYIAPEVFSRIYGGVSHKCDVYSFGMLILDMVGERKNYYNGESHTSEMYFPDWIYKDLEQGNMPSRCLANTKEESDLVTKIILVGLWCVQQNPSERPSMNKVVEMLEGPLQSMPHPPKPVLCSPERSPLQVSSTSHGNTYDTYSITA